MKLEYFRLTREHSPDWINASSQSTAIIKDDAVVGEAQLGFHRNAKILFPVYVPPPPRGPVMGSYREKHN